MLLGILNSQAAGGGAGAYDLLETTTLTSSASSVTFSGLGSYSDYAHLQIRAVAHSTNPSSSGFLQCQVNDDTGANYTRHQLRGSGSSVSSFGNTGNNQAEIGGISADNAQADSFTGFVMDILDFSSTNKNTTIRSLNGFANSANNFIYLMSNLYVSTNAITKIKFMDNSFDLSAGTRFSLYGIKGA